MTLKKHSFVLGFIFLVLPLFDMATGYAVVRGLMPEGAVGSPSQLGRFLAICLLLYVNVHSRIPKVLLLLIVWLLAVETYSAIVHNNVAGLLYGYVTVSKVIYMILLYLTLVKYGATHASTVVRFIKLNLVLINASIIFAFVTGLANSTYGWGFGTKGFFASGNGLGVYIGITTIVLMSLKHYKVYEGVGLASIFLSLVTLLLVGTKTSLILTVIISGLVIWLSQLRWLALPFCIALVGLYWSDILEKLMVFFDIIFIRYQSSDSFIHFIFSGRVDYVTGAFNEMLNQDVSFIRWLIGSGSFVSFQDPSLVKAYDLLETDPFDILFMYGFLGCVGYFLFVLFSLLKTSRMPLIFFALTLLVCHSLFAGHVVFNAMSSTLLVVILGLVKMIRSDFFSIGGVNSSTGSKGI